MAFESGSVGFRVFYVPGGLPQGCESAFAAHAAPPIETLGSEPLTGWVTGRHLLDRNIDAESAYLAGYLRLTLMKAERKIPEALLRAECKMEELVHLRASGAAALKRSERSEIRKEITERLLPAMPPTLTGIDVAMDPGEELAWTTATTDKQHDALSVAFREATNTPLIPLTPESAALRRKQVNAADLASTSFTPQRDDDAVGENLGQDFLTWLWFFSEQRGGILRVGNSDIGVLVEGPLTFVLEGEGAYETVVRKGTPELSAEAKTALLNGKKLRMARITLARGEESWSATVNADAFVFRGAKLPKGDAVDPVSRFHERMRSLADFLEAFLSYFDRFLDERADPARWGESRAELHRWVTERKAL